MAKGLFTNLHYTITIQLHNNIFNRLLIISTKSEPSWKSYLKFNLTRKEETHSMFLTKESHIDTLYLLIKLLSCNTQIQKI